MAQKKEDEIMAEYLLKGGKMLEKTCKTCGCPMFEYKGKTFCVVCSEREQETIGTNKQKIDIKTHSSSKASVPSTIDTVTLAEELTATINELCTRIRNEDDPERCLKLMDSVKIGSEALQILHQL
ncbi:MAG: Sjogren's syndrome/scleroderma autoantigen 1 family protein [Methanoregulaceae archaeon]|jgi:UPF0148 protein